MMKELYSENQPDILRSVGKRYVCVSAAVFVLTAAICAVVCFFVDETNAGWLKAVNIALSAIGGSVVLYWLFDRILPSFARRKYLVRLLSSDGKTLTGSVEDTGRDLTVARYISARELKLTDDKGNSVLLYWDSEVPLPVFDGGRVAFRVVQNRIVAYEVTP